MSARQASFSDSRQASSRSPRHLTTPGMESGKENGRWQAPTYRWVLWYYRHITAVALQHFGLSECVHDLLLCTSFARNMQHAFVRTHVCICVCLCVAALRVPTNHHSYLSLTWCTILCYFQPTSICTTWVSPLFY